MKKSELRQLVKEAFEDFIKKNNEEETEVMDAENQPEEVEVEAEEESPIKGDLQAIADAAGKAVAAFKGDEELEDWVKSHIAAAKELITHAADFLGSDEDAEEGAEEIEDNENVVNEDKKYPSFADPLELFPQEYKELLKKLQRSNNEKERKNLIDKMNVIRKNIKLEPLTNESVNEDKKASAKKGSKPDFLDLDKDGDKKEPMKKAAKEGMGNEVGDKVYFKGDLGEKYPSSQGYYGIIEDTTPARNYNMMATYEVVVYDKNDNEIRTIKTDFTNLTSKAVNETAELKKVKSKEQMSLDMTLAKLDDAGKAEYLKKFDAASKKALSGNTEELALLIATQQLGQLRNEVKEEPKKELKVKKLQADKFKEDIKDLAAKNEHGKILQLIKKLEQYVKTHKSKGEN